MYGDDSRNDAFPAHDPYYERLFELSLNGTLILEEGRIVRASRRAAELLDYSDAALRALPSIIEIVAPGDRDRVSAALASHGDAARIAFSVVRGNGSMARMEAEFAPAGTGSSPHQICALREVSGHEGVLEELRVTEDLYRAIFENTGNASIIIEEDTTIVLANTEWERLTGYNRAEIEGKMSWTRFVVPEDLARMKSYHARRRHVDSSAPRKYEFRLVDRHGNIRFISNTVAMLPGTRRSIASLVDITDLKLAESQREAAVESLRRSEERFRRMADNITDGLIITEDGEIVYVNSRACEIYGYPREELMAMNALVLAELGEREKMRSFQSREGGPGTPPEEQEYWVRRKDGGRRYIHNRYSVVSAGGSLIRHIVTTDITERKRIEDALEQERERLAVTLRSIGDGVIATGTDGTVVLMNKVAEELTGWTLAHAAGRGLDEIFPVTRADGGEELPNPAHLVLESAAPATLESPAILVTHNGKKYDISSSASPIRDRSGAVIGAVLVFRDITTQRRAEAEHARAQKIDSIGILAGGIAHDFNNILTGILGNISLARISAPDNPGISQVLGEAEKASMRAKDLTQQLLTFSKGGSPIKRTVTLGEIIRESATFALSGSNVRCEFQIAPDLFPVEADQGQIGQVIHNLVINAVQAMPQGGVMRITARNTSEALDAPDASPGARFVEIMVIDSGLGIPPEHLGKIFDPYFTTKQKGSGLGLATSYSIVKKHDGHIIARSRMGEGATLTVYLPASADSPSSPHVPADAPLKGSGSILVMDDEEMLLSMAKSLLSHLGYRVSCARDGKEACAMYEEAMARNEKFDAVIMDLTVPGGWGGKETIARLRELDPSVKAIVSSGYSNDPIMARYRDYGFIAVLEKPYRITELSSVLAGLF